MPKRLSFEGPLPSKQEQTTPDLPRRVEQCIAKTYIEMVAIRVTHSKKFAWPRLDACILAAQAGRR